MGSFYGGTLAEYIRYCDDRYNGKFKLKKYDTSALIIYKESTK